MPGRRRSKPKATRKQLEYAAARARGRTRKNALKDAGYQPGTDASARQMAYAIERNLRDRNVLDAALAAQGLGPELFARKLRAAINSRNASVRMQALDKLSRVLGYEKPAPVSENTAVDGIGYEERRILALRCVEIIEASRASRPATGTGMEFAAGAVPPPPDPAGGRARPGQQPAAADPPPA